MNRIALALLLSVAVIACSKSTTAPTPASTTSTSTSTSTTTTSIPAVARVTISGVVTDAVNNQPIVGATATAVNVLTQTNVTARTDSNGFYSLGGVGAGSATFEVRATNYITSSANLSFNVDTRRDVKLERVPPAVEYRVTGTARRCSATYANSTGGTNQQSVPIPFSYTWSSARSGDFLYMSCQIDTPGDQGNITVTIYKTGSFYRSGQAVGFPNIATASGTY